MVAQPPHSNLLILTHRKKETLIADARSNLSNKHNFACMKVNLSVIMRPMLDVYKEDFSLISA